MGKKVISVTGASNGIGECMVRNLIVVIFIMMSFFVVPMSFATEELAEQTEKDCGYCHLDIAGGGELTKAGKKYLPSSSVGTKISKIFRLIIGYIHILTAIFWFGTILYVHIVLKPIYASKGLPGGEVKVGLISMVVMAVTGAVMTIYRVPSMSFLIETRFGILLLIKISLFLIMGGTALYVVFFIGPKLGRRRVLKPADVHKGLSADGLLAYDGTGGNAMIIAYKNKLYDVSKSKFWKSGKHFERHDTGSDLTDALKQAPHGEEKILNMPQVGDFIPDEKEKKTTPHEKIFYFIAYMNLIFVFLIILILALWRWL